MKKIKIVANPLSKAAWGSFSYLDRKLKTAPEEPEFLMSVSINNECNLQCAHCVERDYQRGEERYDLLKSRLDEIPDKDIIWTSIAGKEPTATPNRLEEVAKIARRNSKKVILMSNGILLDKKLQERLNEKIDYLDISIDGMEAYKNPHTNAWKNALTASENGFEKTTIMTVLMRGNYNKIGDLINKVADESKGNLAHSIGFYLGQPNDKGLLSEDEMILSLKQIAKQQAKTIVQIPLAYSKYLHRIFTEFGVEEFSKRYDSSTGMPTFDFNGHRLAVASHLETPITGLRAEIDGNVYFGCSHLMLKGDTSYLAIGNLEKESLKDIKEKIFSGKSDLVEKASYVDERCLDSKCFEYCRGGDRLNGVIFTGEAKDPFCEKLK